MRGRTKKQNKPAGPQATANQRKFIATLVERVELDEAGLRRLLQGVAGVETVGELRKRSASDLIDALLAREEPGPRPISKKQLALARKLVRERKVPRAHLATVLEECSEGGAGKLGDLSHEEASAVIDQLLAWKAKDAGQPATLAPKQQARLDEVWQGLEEIGWTAAWSKLKRERKRSALARLAKGGEARLKAGMRGLLIDHRLGPFDGEELGYDRILYGLARASERAFDPARVRARHDGHGNVTVAFTWAGESHQLEVEESDLERLIELVNLTLEKAGKDERFLEASRKPDDDDDICLAFVSKAACRAAKRRRWF